MSKNNMSRHEVHQKRRRSKKRNKGCLFFFIIIAILLLVIVGAGAYFFYNVSDTIDGIQQSRPEEQVNYRDDTDSDPVQEKESFSVLLLGVDTGTEGRVDQGRSDIMVVITVNPQTERMTLTSIPRDTLTEIVGTDSEDKINHAYAFGGVSMAANTVQNLLDIPIDYTISANMQGFADIINALDGVPITSIDTFEQGEYYFVEGESYIMDGEMALAYTRNRYDTGGDYSRQERARQLVSSIIQEATQITSITNLPSILSSLNGNVLTDLSFGDMQSIALNYRDSINNVETLQLDGVGEMIDGVYYEIINPSSLSDVQEQLKSELNL